VFDEPLTIEPSTFIVALAAVRLPRLSRVLFQYLLRGVNYYCRLTTTVSAGEGSAKEC